MAVSAFGIVCIAFGVLVSVVFTAVLCFAFYLHFFVHQKYKHIPGPPRKSFFLGNLPTIFKNSREGKIFTDLLTVWASEYGPVVAIYVVNQVFISATSAEAVKEFAVSGKHPKPKVIYQSVGTVYGCRFMGTGLVTEVDHDIWFRKRAICDPAFHRKSMRKYMGHFNACADLLVQKLSKVADGKTEVVLLHEMNKVTLDVITKVAFGLDLDSLNQEDFKFNKAVATALDAMDRGSVFPWTKYDPRPSMRKYRREAVNACRLQRKVGRECVRKRLQAKARGEALPDDVLTLMMEADDRFDDLESDVDLPHILDEFVTFFIAGQETTANTLTFTFMELCRHPEMLHRLRTEIEAVIGDHKNVEFEDLSKLSYTSATFKEALRKYPPILTTREVAADTTLHGIRIPKGSIVMLVPYTMSRLEQYFKDPLVFEPERFLGGQVILPNTYFPFALGPRSCIGQQFAMIESKVLIAKLLKNFTFELVPDQSFQIIQEGTIKLKDGCRVYIKPRDAEF